MGKTVSLQNKELKGLYTLCFVKIKSLKILLESMENTFKDMYITRCSDKYLEMFICSNEMINLAMKGIDSKQDEMEEMLKG